MRSRHFLDKRRFDLPATGNGAVMVERSGESPIEGLLVSLSAGELGVWIGEYSGQPPAFPDWTFHVDGKVNWVPLPRGYYTFTLASIGPVQTNATGSLSMIALYEGGS